MKNQDPKYQINTLAPFINDGRKARIADVLDHRIQGVTLAIERPSDVNNALAAIRSAEALGLSDIHLIQTEGSADAIKAITQGAFYWVNIHFYSSFSEFFSLIKPDFHLAGGVLRAEPAPIHLSKLSLKQPLCLLLGNESTGLTEEAIDHCDTLYCIPMCGMSESLNLSVCAAISLYDTTQQLRQQLGTNSDLSQEKRMALQAKYYGNSVSPRLLRKLFSED